MSTRVRSYRTDLRLIEKRVATLDQNGRGLAFATNSLEVATSGLRNDVANIRSQQHRSDRKHQRVEMDIERVARDLKRVKGNLAYVQSLHSSGSRHLRRSSDEDNKLVEMNSELEKISNKMNRLERLDYKRSSRTNKLSEKLSLMEELVDSVQTHVEDVEVQVETFAADVEKLQGNLGRLSNTVETSINDEMFELLKALIQNSGHEHSENVQVPGDDIYTTTEARMASFDEKYDQRLNSSEMRTLSTQMNPLGDRTTPTTTITKTESTLEEKRKFRKSRHISDDSELSNVYTTSEVKDTEPIPSWYISTPKPPIKHEIIDIVGTDDRQREEEEAVKRKEDEEESVDEESLETDSEELIEGKEDGEESKDVQYPRRTTSYEMTTERNDGGGKSYNVSSDIVNWNVNKSTTYEKENASKLSLTKGFDLPVETSPTTSPVIHTEVTKEVNMGFNYNETKLRINPEDHSNSSFKGTSTPSTSMLSDTTTTTELHLSMNSDLNNDTKSGQTDIAQQNTTHPPINMDNSHNFAHSALLTEQGVNQSIENSISIQQNEVVFNLNETILQQHINVLEKRIQVLESSMTELTSSTVPAGIQQEVKRVLTRHMTKLTNEIDQNEAESTNIYSAMNQKVRENFNRSSSLEVKFESREQDLNRLRTISVRNARRLSSLANQVRLIH